MIRLSETTEQLVKKLFPQDNWPLVIELLENDCGDNLPFSQNATPKSKERIRFAAVKVSEGQTSKLVDAVYLAQVDWRDLLVAAGFANDVNAHREWSDKVLNEG